MDEIYIYALLAFVLVPLGWIIGRLMDPVWRCIQMRKWLKAPYIVLNVVRKDNTLISTHVVNAEKDIIVLENTLWIITKGTIHLKTKEGKILKETGFTLNNSMLKYEEGAPTVYVDHDNITPVNFYDSGKSSVKPGEVGSTMLAWVFNQYAKNMASLKQNGQMILVILLLVGLCTGLVWTVKTTVEDNNVKITAIQAALTNSKIVPANGQISNGSITINQPKQPGAS